MNNDAIDKTQAFDEAASAARQPRRLQLLRAGSSQFGIFADEIATIVVWRKPTPLPQASKPVLGVVSVQGRMLTVLDLASMTGDEAVQNHAPEDVPHNVPNNAPDKGPDGAPTHLVALRGDEQLALAVGEVGESIDLDDGGFDPESGSAGRLVLGVLRRDGAQITILNLQELFPTAIQGRERRRRRF